MNIKPLSQDSFKGYDARPIKGFLMSSNSHSIAEHMAKIGEKEGFKIFMVKGSKVEANPNFKEILFNPELWAQDYWTILKDKLLAKEYNKTFYIIRDAFNLCMDFTEKICHETDKIKHLRQNLWDLFDEMREPKGLKGRDLIETAKDFKVTKNNLESCIKRAHIDGGNVFIVKGDDNQEEVIIGEDELKNFDLEEIQAFFEVDKVTVLPQMDYHLDLFIRPLDNKRILLTDDEISLNLLQAQLEHLEDFMINFSEENRTKFIQIKNNLERQIAKFTEAIEKNPYAKAGEVEKILKEKGFEVFRVPGRIYEILQSGHNAPQLKQLCNYINANTFKKNNGELVYITNYSDFDEKIMGYDLKEMIGLNFQQAFISYLRPFVNEESIYFINGEDNFISETMLPKLQGGIHCVCAEIPDGIKIKEN